MFITYWFGVRDTWEIDNYSQIAERCEAVQLAVRQSDDEAAEQAYAELHRFIGEHTIEQDWIATSVNKVRDAYAPVNQRIEKARSKREARELTERKRRKARAVAESRRQQAREAATVARGQIDSDMVYKVRKNWRDLGFGSADQAEQEYAIAIIIIAVKKAVQDPLDCEATLDYIQRNIDSW